MSAWKCLLLATVLAGCASAGVTQTYTEDPKTTCERHLGWWRPNLLGGYCERR